jgi:FMN phosphatase YigB (HAD superfamily)
MFDTLVRFDRDRLPRLHVMGREVRPRWGASPGGPEALPGVTLEAFYAAFLASYRDAEGRREIDHREIPAVERFGFCYARLGVDAEAVPRELTERLIRLHMRCLAAAADPLPGRPELLDWLAGLYRLGLVSNFDYTPTVRHILEEGGILDLFDAVVVSDVVGWRKPSARIFEAAFARLGVGPRECLFVGDRPDIDVAGAKGSGWTSPGSTRRAAFPPGPGSEFTLRASPICESCFRWGGSRASRRHSVKIA